MSEKVSWIPFRFHKWAWGAAFAAIALDLTIWVNPDMINMMFFGQEVLPDFPATVVLALALGVAGFGPLRRLAGPYLTLLGVLGALATFLMVKLHAHAIDIVQTVVWACQEEFVFRVALIAVFATILRRVTGRDLRLVSILAAGAVFATAPGHLAQVSNVFEALMFVVFALQLGLVVQTTGAVWFAGLAHAISNLITEVALAGVVPMAATRFAEFSLMMVLAWATHVGARTQARAAELPAKPRQWNPASVAA